MHYSTLSIHLTSHNTEINIIDIGWRGSNLSSGFSPNIIGQSVL